MRGPAIDLALFTYSAIEDDTVVGQIDGYGDTEGSIPPAVVHLPYGFYSRPLDPGLDANGQPDPKQACQALCFWRGGQLNIVPSFDPRVLPKIPSVHKGDSVMYGADGSFVRIDCERHTISQQTTLDGTVDGPSIYTSLGPDGFFIITPWGRLELGPRGFHVVLANGARIDLGGLGLPAPLSSVGTLATISADIVNVAGAQTMLGVSPTDTYLPAAHASPSDPPVTAVPWVMFLSGSVKVAASI